MRRFHSPLQKIHDVCEQQKRLAQLEVARCRQAWEAAIAQERRAVAEVEQARRSHEQGLCGPTQIGVVRGGLARIGMAQEALLQRRTQVEQAWQHYLLARQKLQELDARARSLAEVIERQRQEYRREQQLMTQNNSDEMAAGRWAAAHGSTGGEESSWSD